MPFGMSDTIQSVAIQGKLYVGGGTAKYSANSHRVMVYDIFTKKWDTLPLDYKAQHFAMAAIDIQLVLVGGISEEDDSLSRELGIWQDDIKKWAHPYPSMHAARCDCSAIAYSEWLVVAGGWFGEECLSSVEVLNTECKQWYNGPPTPLPWDSMKTAIVGDMSYFMGGYIDEEDTTNVYSVSIPVLLSQITSGTTSTDSDIWEEIIALPKYCSTPVSVNGSLLAMGGDGGWVEGADEMLLASIHCYQPYIKEWVKIGDLPIPCENCTCTMISDREIVMLGGSSSQDRKERRMFTALL